MCNITRLILFLLLGRFRQFFGYAKDEIFDQCIYNTWYSDETVPVTRTEDLYALVYRFISECLNIGRKSRLVEQMRWVVYPGIYGNGVSQNHQMCATDSCYSKE